MLQGRRWRGVVVLGRTKGTRAEGRRAIREEKAGREEGSIQGWRRGGTGGLEGSWRGWEGGGPARIGGRMITMEKKMKEMRKGWGISWSLRTMSSEHHRLGNLGWRDHHWREKGGCA